MKLNLISKYRTQLMGISILFVVLFHSELKLEAYPFLNFVKTIGYGGVDVFMIISGFGAFFSLSRDSSLKSYYKKRALRILPYYWPIVLLYSIILVLYGLWPVKNIFYNLFALNYWFNWGMFNMFDWYIPSLLVLYLFTPLFYKFFKKNKLVTSLTVIVVFYAICYYAAGGKYIYLNNFIYRVPIYIIGFCIGDFISANKDYVLSKIQVCLLAITLLGGIVLLYYFYRFETEHFTSHGLYLVPFLFIAFPISLFASYFLSLFEKYKFPILTFFGTYTLTIYIFHERIRNIFFALESIYPDTFSILLTIILAVVWQKAVSKVVARYSNRS